ncbi:MAG: histidine ammonia-lyase [Phycisphaerales bacterium]
MPRSTDRDHALPHAAPCPRPVPTLVLDGRPLSSAEVEAGAHGRTGVVLGDEGRRLLERGRHALERALAGGRAIYGVNTGFGSLARVRLEGRDLEAMQANLVRSHASGVGPPLPREIVRAMMLVLAASLTRGHSGVRPVVVEHLLAMLEADLVPVVPSRGSVGASGDLAPLAHIALAMLGEGSIEMCGRTVPGGLGLKWAGLEPLALAEKEGLSLINGTHLMAASGALSLAAIARVVDAAEIAAAMAIDACRATDAFLDPRLHEVRRQPGPQAVADRIRAMLDGSEILPSHAENDPRVQDPYCLRATPQVLGAAIDAIAYAREAIERELGAVTDNPLLFEEDGVAVPLSGANFHGMPIAIALDTLAIALCHVAGISERRVNWLFTASDPQNPVTPHLSPTPGLHSGLMIAQYAAASCCNELQTLATPASVSNIPTCAGIEDYNSMGATSAAKLRSAVECATSVIAIELLAMCEGLEFQRPLRSGAAIEAAHARIREVVPRLERDRPPAPDIAAIERLVSSGSLRH